MVPSETNCTKASISKQDSSGGKTRYPTFDGDTLCLILSDFYLKGKELKPDLNYLVKSFNCFEKM